mmetsp:Transcript_8154/g.19130  ORF Transcript_8154/g.19130 Transcript_8154/m.19130 type:complete len:250 (-) Transcript_8154:1073-1822(-)
MAHPSRCLVPSCWSFSCSSEAFSRMCYSTMASRFCFHCCTRMTRTCQSRCSRRWLASLPTPTAPRKYGSWVGSTWSSHYSRRRAHPARCSRRPSWRSVPSSPRLPSTTRRHCRSERQMASICSGSCCSRRHGEAQTTLTQRQAAARLPRWSETLRPGYCYAAASEITRTRGARVAAVATRAWLRMPSARCASSSPRSVTASSSGDSSRPTCTPLSSTWGSMKEIYRGTRRSCASSQRSLQRREQRCKRR